jgi:hypothetical protein
VCDVVQANLKSVMEIDIKIQMFRSVRLGSVANSSSNVAATSMLDTRQAGKGHSEIKPGVRQSRSTTLEDSG